MDEYARSGWEVVGKVGISEDLLKEGGCCHTAVCSACGKCVLFGGGQIKNDALG